VQPHPLELQQGESEHEIALGSTFFSASDPTIRVAAGIFRSNAVMKPRLHCGVTLRRAGAVAGVEARLVPVIQAGSGRVGYFVVLHF
jgi:hypothetical protein